MFTVRLSWVITGCGGKETTCSRRSIRSRIRSMNGTRNVNPAPAVALYRPRRSITAAVACGTICTALNTATTTTSTTRLTTANTAACICSPVLRLRVPLGPGHDHRGRARDGHDGDLLARLDHVDAVEGLRRPHGATDLDPTPGAVH